MGVFLLLSDLKEATVEGSIHVGFEAAVVDELSRVDAVSGNATQ